MHWPSHTTKNSRRSSSGCGSSKMISRGGINTSTFLCPNSKRCAKRCKPYGDLVATPSPEQVIDGQRQDWNRVAGGWEKWDRFFDEQMAFLNHRLVGDARLRTGLRVLDLGSGTGYPALLAAQTVGATGRVVGIDLAEQMLEVAGRKATSLGLSNVTFRT